MEFSEYAATTGSALYNLDTCLDQTVPDIDTEIDTTTVADHFLEPDILDTESIRLLDGINTGPSDTLCAINATQTDLATDIYPVNSTVGLMKIAPSTNQIFYQWFPSAVPLPKVYDCNEHRMPSQRPSETSKISKEW